MLILQSSKKICPESRIVKCEEYAVFAQSEDIIANAKLKRQKMFEQAEAQIQLMKEDAQKSIAADRAKSEEECRQQMEGERLIKIFEQMDHGIQFFSNLNSSFVSTLQSMFLKILGEIPPEERICSVVKNAIKLLPEGKCLSISVHPDQATLLQEKVNELIELKPNLERVEVVINKDLNLDECTLETETGILEASVSIQLETLMKAIQEALR